MNERVAKTLIASGTAIVAVGIVTGVAFASSGGGSEVPGTWWAEAAERECGPIDWDAAPSGIVDYEDSAFGTDGLLHARVWRYEAQDGRTVEVYGDYTREDPLDSSSPLYDYLAGVECDV